MTREEALEWFKDRKKMYCLDDKCQQAEDMAIKALEQEPRWIPVSERLPEERINPITHDYYEYQCTFCSGQLYDVRHYKYGGGHWWHGAGQMDDYVIAWMPLPEPYKAERKEVNDRP